MPTNTTTLRFAESKLEKLKKELVDTVEKNNHRKLSLEDGSVSVFDRQKEEIFLAKGEKEIELLKKEIEETQASVDSNLSQYVAKVQFKIDVIEQQIKVKKQKIEGILEGIKLDERKIEELKKSL